MYNTIQSLKLTIFFLRRLTSLRCCLVVCLRENVQTTMDNKYKIDLCSTVYYDTHGRSSNSSSLVYPTKPKTYNGCFQFFSRFQLYCTAHILDVVDKKENAFHFFKRMKHRRQKFSTSAPIHAYAFVICCISSENVDPSQIVAMVVVAGRLGVLFINKVLIDIAAVNIRVLNTISIQFTHSSACSRSQLVRSFIKIDQFVADFLFIKSHLKKHTVVLPDLKQHWTPPHRSVEE